MTSISGDDFVDILGPDPTRAATGSRRTGRRPLPAVVARPVALIRAIPDVGTYVGVALIVIGFVLIAICWGKVAGLTSVGLQMPFIASAGLPGLGLIVTGIGVVGAASREKDAALRRAQLSELASTLRQLRLLVGEPETPVTRADPPAPYDGELTTELMAILDEPAAHEPAATRTPSRAARAPRPATARSQAQPTVRAAATPVSRPTGTGKRVSR